MIRYGSGHVPARPTERCACGAPGVMTWLDLQGRRCATTCTRNLPECKPATVQAVSR